MAVQLLTRDLSFKLYLCLVIMAIQAAGAILSWFAWETGNTLLVLVSIIVWLLWFLLVFILVKPSSSTFVNRDNKPIRFIALSAATFMTVVIISIFTMVFVVNDDAINNNELIGQLKESFQYGDDTASLHQASEHLINGINPYSAYNIIDVVEDYDLPITRITPLRQGDFADVFPFPTEEQFSEAWDKADTSSGNIPSEFLSKLVYPSGSFIIAAPFVALGLGDIRLFYLFCALSVAALALFWSPRKLLSLVIAVFFINVLLWLDIASGRTDTLFILFILLTWILRKRLLLAALFMGLAVTTKQMAWTYLLFFLVLQIREVGWRQLIKPLGIIIGVFIVFNLAFIIDSPHSWLEGIISQFIDPYFPRGVGFVSLTFTHILPANQILFSTLQVTALFLAIVWYYYNCLRYPYAGLLLPVLPFFFGWQSYSRYLYFAPILILIMLIRDNIADKFGINTVRSDAH